MIEDDGQNPLFEEPNEPQILRPRVSKSATLPLQLRLRLVQATKYVTSRDLELICGVSANTIRNYCHQFDVDSLPELEFATTADLERFLDELSIAIQVSRRKSMIGSHRPRWLRDMVRRHQHERLRIMVEEGRLRLNGPLPEEER